MTRPLLALIWLVATSVLGSQEELYDQAWLRYHSIGDETFQEAQKRRWAALCMPESLQDSAILGSIQKEWYRGLLGLYGTKPEQVRMYYSAACRRGGGEHGLILEPSPADDYAGYRIKTNVAGCTNTDEPTCTFKTIIHATTEEGLLQGAFGLLRYLQTHPGEINNDNNHTLVEFDSEPKTNLRIWNVWDNLNGTALLGNSVFDWQKLPDVANQRYQDYARLLASVGCNGISLGNVVDACSVTNRGLLNTTMLSKVAELASIFGDWGIGLYLAPCYDSPVYLDEQKTAEPVEYEVQNWWEEVVENLNQRIPTFRGFLFDSETDTHGRNHSVSANMMARFLKPYNGTLIWRVATQDRAIQVHESVVAPFDGEFDDNVILQVQSGRRSVRQAPSPLFTNIVETNMMLELDTTQEFLGQEKALVSLASQWEYYLSQFPLSNDGSLRDLVSSGVAGISNVHNASTWAGSIMGMANVYAWGRMAWDPYLTAEQVLDEWIMMTFGWEEKIRVELLSTMLASWEVYENYTCPLGLGSCVSTQNPLQADPSGQNDLILHADANGIGYDRTLATGSGFVRQYDPTVAKALENPNTCPVEVLLFFHHVSWKHKLASRDNMALIEFLFKSHAQGVRSVDIVLQRFGELQFDNDEERYQEILTMLQSQVGDAQAFCMSMVAFLSKNSGIFPSKSTKALCDPTFELEMEEILIEKEEREAAGVGLGLWLVIAVGGMVFTAYQMQEFPDGIYASICRVVVVSSGQVIRFITMPCRAIFGKPDYHGTGHMPIGQSDYQDPYNGQNGNYT